MRTRSISLVAVVTIGLLAGCDGANSSVGTDEMPVAGNPNPSAVVTKGNTGGNGGGSETPAGATIVGTWGMILAATAEDPAVTFQFTFEQGGSGSVAMSAMGQSKTTPLTWSGSGSNFQVVIEGESVPATLSGSTLTLETPDGDWVLTKE